ncbi:MAG TPA: hypothetical protein VFW82_09840, partial [Dyella sp.]|nr:hypothetical protein [Dyella sp.]
MLMVIGMLVVVSLLAAAMATTVMRMRADQQREDALVEGLRDAQSTEATAIYLLIGQRVTFAGLTIDNQLPMTADERTMLAQGEVPISNVPVGNEIRLDGTPYRGRGSATFALQDDRGLVSVNWSNQVIRDRWL